MVFIGNHVSLGSGNAGRGGGFWTNGTTVTATGLEFVENTATTAGGAIFGQGGAMNISDSCFIRNSDTAFFVNTGTFVADDNWWGHPAGPGPPGDTKNANVTVNSSLVEPPPGADCQATQTYNCELATLTPGMAANTFDIQFSTGEAGFTGLAFMAGTDVTFNGFTPAGCENSGTDQTCTASVTITNPGSPNISARFVVRTNLTGPSTCMFTNANGLPVELMSFEVE